MSVRQPLEVRYEDPTPQKWSVSLEEGGFASFFSQGGAAVKRVFGEGSFFSPLLFDKFFDPSDAFPLWDFDSDVLLSNLKSSTGTRADWFATEAQYVLRAQLPDLKNHEVQICVDNGKVVEISGQRRRSGADGTDWRTGRWWEHGYVRRLELPENAEWRKMEASVDEDHYLEVKIPKNASEHDVPGEKTVEPRS